MNATNFVKKSLYVAVIGVLACSTVVNAADAPATPATTDMAAPVATETTAAPSPFNTTDPISLAMSWLQDAKSAGLAPNFVIMGTLKNGHPSIKLISSGEMTADGYVFKLNESSNTSKEINASMNATLLMTWSDKLAGGMQKQIRVYGNVMPQGTVEMHALTYQGKSYDYNSRTYILKPAGIQFGISNFAATAQSGVANYVNFMLEGNAWKKEEDKVIGFDITPQ